MKVIEVNNVSKEYHLGSVAKDSLVDTVKMLFKRKNKKEDAFWALKNISFDLNEGEVLGIIGKNGAGKSTLLKVLSRITEPTSGEIKLRGRVASLLEVGTGFHPELSGRENIFLNGSILGMKRKEIKTKFDQIVDFAGVEKFIDTPVKHYSSGMYVRLAFSVAAHLEPEILIIDEVLAVGDADFQKKCLGKMKDVAGQGRTVLFVSHNMAAVENLCTRAILLKNGSIIKEGKPHDVIEHYYGVGTELNTRLAYRAEKNNTNKILVVKSIEVSASLNEIKPLLSGSNCHFSIEVQLNEETNVSIRLAIFNKNNDLLFICNNSQAKHEYKLSHGLHTILCTIENLPLYEGEYRLDVLVLSNKEIVESIENAIRLNVGAGDFHQTGKISNKKVGMILQRQKWDVLN